MNSSIFEKVKKIDEIPTLPVVAVEVISLAQSSDVSIRKLSEIIHRDPALSSKVLRVANSAYYRRGTRNIDTIQRGIMILGLNEILNISTSISVFSSFRNTAVDHPEMRAMFWNHCAATAIISRLIAEKIGMETNGREFVGGLLHDIGKIILYEYFHDEFMKAFDLSYEHLWPLYEGESRILGTTHMEVGAFLAERWNLPKYLQDIIHWHHEPSKACDPACTALVSIADLLAKAKEFSCGGDRMSFVLRDQEAWQILRNKGYAVDDLDLERITFEMENLGREVKRYIDTFADAGEERRINGSL